MKFLAAAFILFLISFQGLSAQECSGMTPQVHRLKNFHFSTNSWTKSATDRLEYVTCVANHDTGSDLYVNWFIPGPYRAYVPENEVLIWPRLRDDTEPRAIRSCIEYGNLGETSVAEFLGTKRDEQLNVSDQSPLCGQTAGHLPSGDMNTQEGKELPEIWTSRIRIFFPTDAENPRESMHALDGQVGIKRISSSEYTTFLEYSISPIEGRSGGSISAISVRPNFFEAEEIFIAAYKEEYPEDVRLDDKGSIQFQFQYENAIKWHAADAVYELVEAETETVVGTVPMPIFTAANQ